jgi:23S rRNA (uracil1939-C5)-methyltransferase
VAELSRCLQVSDAMNAVFEALRARLADRPGLAARIDDVLLAEGRAGGGVVAGLAGRLSPAETSAALELAESPGLAGFGMRLGSRARESFVLLRGSAHVTSTVLGTPLRAHVLSFFQGNRFLVEPLAAHVRAVLPEGGTLLDLYAGVGLFALTLAPRAARVVGIESGGTAVEDAAFNAERSGRRNVRFVEGDVARTLATLPADPEERIVLDPPRSGAGADVVNAIAAREPLAVAYVSCDPPRLGRDLRTFTGHGYRVERIDAFDLFPDTFHLESVALLKRM